MPRPPLRTMNEAQLLEALRDPDWRLRNLYWIINKAGKKVMFRPNVAQQALLRDLWYRNLILKARQRGFSTLIQLMMLDTCLFNDNTRAAVIAQDQEASGIIFRDKIKYAYDNLPPLVREMAPLTRDSASELVLGNNSSLRVATSVRSGTLQFLHVSEFGKICAKYPDKAREVLTGSLPAVDQGGMVFIESTAEGREGAFFDMCTLAQADQQAGKKLTKLDMRFHFFSWWDADEYQMPADDVIITPADNVYFNQLEVKIGREISREQRAWYVTTRRADFGGDSQMMKQEYPSTPEEAFEQSTEGTYYAEQLAQARREGRITRVPYDPRYPVNTFWDIGNDDETPIWFHQQIGLRNHIIDYLEGSGEPPSYYVAEVQKRGYVLGKHYLPHDGAHRKTQANTLKTYADMLEDLGLKDIEIVPKIDDVTRGIQIVRQTFHTYWFDEEKCADGLKHIELYRKEWNERLGVWSDRPRHDKHSHASDALRQHAQAEIGGLIRLGSSQQRPRRRNRGGMVV